MFWNENETYFFCLHQVRIRKMSASWPVSKPTKATMNSTLNATLIDERENISDLLTFNGTYDVDAYLLDNWGPKHLPLDVVVPITVVYVLIFVSGLVGNVAVCAVIIRNTSMHTATNCYLFSLAVSDLTVLLFGSTLLFLLYELNDNDNHHHHRHRHSDNGNNCHNDCVDSDYDDSTVNVDVHL